MADTEIEKAVINDRIGDGSFLVKLPPPIAKIVRKLGLRNRNMRQTRLLRTCVRLLPTLRRLESSSFEADLRILNKYRFSQIMKHAQALERCLKMFTDGWASGAIEVIGEEGTPLKAGEKRKVVGSCGMSVGDVERYLVYEAARSLMKRHPNFDLTASGFLNCSDPLTKLHKLEAMEPDALLRLQKGMGKTFANLFKPESEPLLNAIVKLKGYHVAGLQTGMGKRFGELLTWKPDFIEAITEAFTCPEQIKDLGENILVVTNPESLRAIGKWEIRDVTDRVNEERKASGHKSSGGPFYETDIGVVQRMLGREFSILMEQPAPVLESTARMVEKIRKITSKNDRADRIEEFKQFVSRYLTYLSADAVKALHMSGDGDTIEIREALGVLEGLWTKERVGRKFFETHLKGPVGIEALDSLVKGLMDMKKRGSIKTDTNIASVIATSDLFDSHLTKVIG